MTDYRPTLITYHILSALCVATFLLFSYITFRVVKISRCSDPIFIIMLVLLQLSLVANLVFFQFQVKVIKSEDTVPWNTWYCASASVNYLPAILLALASILNINKWIYFNWRVKALRLVELKDEQQM